MSNSKFQKITAIILIMSLMGSASLQTSAAEIVPINQNHMNTFHTHLVPSKPLDKFSSIKDVESQFSNVLNSKKVLIESQPDYDLVAQTDLNSPKKFDNDNISLMSDQKIFDCGAEGTDVKATLKQSGILTISGTGKMKDYSVFNNDLAPWAQKDTEEIKKDYRKSINSVIIEEGVTSIGDNAFLECEDLTSVIIPKSVEIIGDNAFANCKNLNKINIANANEGEGLKTICSGAFWGTALVNVDIPDSVTSIEESAFKSCSKLNCLIIGNGVKTIGNYAFADCPNLYSISFKGTKEPNGYFTQLLPFDNVYKNVDKVRVPKNYEGEKFCNLEISKVEDSEINTCKAETSTLEDAKKLLSLGLKKAAAALTFFSGILSPVMTVILSYISYKMARVDKRLFNNDADYENNIGNDKYALDKLSAIKAIIGGLGDVGAGMAQANIPA